MNPIELFSVKDGTLSVGGTSVKDILSKTGSPLYLYDAAIMRRQYRRLKSELPGGVSVHYSIKANPNKAVAKLFCQAGAGAEVASEAELRLALSAGFKPDKIIFAGPGKTKKEVELAVKKKIGSINIESETELERVLNASGASSGREYANPARIAFRVNLDFTDNSGYEVMIGGPRKFGIDDDAIRPLVEKAMNDSRVEVTGFHCFAGTQINEAKTLTSAYRTFARWAVKLSESLKMDIATLNFGGGLGIPFKENEQELNVKALGQAFAKIKNIVQESKYCRNTKFLLEPGRYLVGPSGVYISTVTDIKVSRGKTFVMTDGGIHHALIPIVLNKSYPTAILNKMNRRKTANVTVAGPLCASSDQFSRELKLPKPEIGDLIGVFNSGAYGYTAGMVYFLSHPTPAEAMVDNGKLYLIREPKRPESGICRRI